MKKFYYYIPLILQNLFFVTFFPLYKFFLKLEIKGQENLKDIKRPIILAPNHTSELDPTIIPLIFSPLSFLLPIYSVIYPIEKYKTPDFKWRRYIYGKLFFNILGGYSSYSGSKDYSKSLKDHIFILKQGKTVSIFPEGQMTLDGKIGKPRGGLGYLVYTTEAVIVPIAVDTLFNLKFKEFILRQRKVVITVLSPIYKKDIIDLTNPTAEDFRAVSQKVLDRIQEIMG
ncbi:MAG: lysophospholipid acyltransferase family protein [Candidatus Zambryskibacteria bacterium]|nr:lysophospholipid acyltransferase family protein [Candidatus Zambryskibacteria bacterium]